MQSFSTIAHSNLEICSPAPWPIYRELLSTRSLPERPEILDIGCGKGGILAKSIRLLNGTGIGVELAEGLGHFPTLEARQLQADGKLKFTFEDAGSFFEKTDSTFDLIICIGSSHAVGGPEGFFRFARKHLRPQGQLLLGELVWKAKPDPAFLAFLECAEEDQMYSAQLSKLAQQNGLAVQASMACTDEDFEAYEQTLRKNVIDWCNYNNDDPDAAKFAERSNSWWEAREKWARHSLGFEILLAGLA
jgi:cyclopropane fatty-acyl-phospholipid synthase-like methyltransferase